MSEQNNTFTWVIASPSIGSILGPRVDTDFNVSVVSGFTQSAGSVIFNVESGEMGSNKKILTNDMNCSTYEYNSRAFTESPMLVAKGQWLTLDIVDVIGNPGILTVTVTGKK
jgi:hypothetical protein